MKRMILSSIAAASLAFTAAPVTAQDEPEEARTTCTVEFLRFAPNKAETWTEMREKYWFPAAKAAGLPVPTVHWMMDGEWDLMVFVRFHAALRLSIGTGLLRGSAGMKSF